LKLIDAALLCIARSGASKVTIDDIASAVKCSRATVYRTFPGGKEAIFAAAIETEVARFYSTMAVSMGRASDLSELVVSMVTVSAAYLLNHETLAALRIHEPELVMSRLRFGEMDETLSSATTFAQPFFARWLDVEAASRAAELVVRFIVSYLTDPDPKINLEDAETVRAFVDQFLIPGMVSSSTGQLSQHRSTSPRKKGRSTP
jgi:AcrR family transcriptional regulator